MHVRSQQPYNVDDSEWEVRIEVLCNFLLSGDTESVWNWFGEHFPKCVRLVPSRRREQFVRGAVEAYHDERLRD